MVDYEAEYNNRALVPEHPEIFARWTREAQAYRDEMTRAHRAELGIKYGPGARQTIDLFLPAGGDGAPLAMFIHGGYWRSLEPSQFSQIARGANGRGLAVAVVGYELCPHVSVAGIIAQMQAASIYLWRRFKRSMTVYGHSAGGHLAACMLATDWTTLGAPAHLVTAALSVSGVFDLTPLLHVSANADLKLDAAEARKVSPLFWPAPRGRSLDCWCGSAESSEFRRQNGLLADPWGKAGVAVSVQELAGANHFTVLDPLADPTSAMSQRFAALAAPRQAGAA